MDIFACANHQIRFSLYLRISGRLVLSPIIRLLNERSEYPLSWVDGKKDLQERISIKPINLKFREWCMRNKLKTNDPISKELFEASDSGKIDFNFEEVV